VALDYAQLSAACGIADLYLALEMAPAEALGCLASALHAAALLSAEGAAALPALQPTLPHSRVRVHLFNLAHTRLPFRAVRGNRVGQLASVKGTVIRVSAVRSLVTHMAFACATCGFRQLLPAPDGVVQPPGGCSQDGCRSRRFSEERGGAHAVDVQLLKLQELPGNETRVAEEEEAEEELVARTLDVELLGPACDAARVGDVLTVTGLVKTLAEGGAKPGGGGAGGGGGGGGGGRGWGGGRGRGKAAAPPPLAPTLFRIYLAAVSLLRAPRDPCADGEAAATRVLLRAEGAGGASGGAAAADGQSDGQPFSEEELQFVARFAAATRGAPGGALGLLAASLAPAMHGHVLVKAGLVLALLGGSRLEGGEQEAAGTSCDGASVRGEVHVLLVGDPGLGKSQLLAAACAASPRGVLLSGPGCTAVGLTASVGRDPASGAATLEAGACVLAHRGVVALDELDKLPRAQHAPLLEVMEQGTVSVAKAGVSATLPARCSLLCAANPVGGSYQAHKSLQANLNLSAPLLSRFDLVFLLLDRPDEAEDAEMAAHVLHARRRGDAPRAQQRALPPPPDAAGPRAPLEQRLRPGSEAALLPPHLLRKFVEYARRYTRPRLSPAAERVLREHYLAQRAAAQLSPGSLPVTTRSLEALARLTEARCRAELRDVATRADAEDVVELVRAAMPDPGHGGGGGGGGYGRMAAGGPKAAEPRRFLAALAAAAELKPGGHLTHGECVAVADRIMLNVPDVHAALEKLNYEGDILKHGRLYTVQVRCPSRATR